MILLLLILPIPSIMQWSSDLVAPQLWFDYATFKPIGLDKDLSTLRV